MEFRFWVVASLLVGALGVAAPPPAAAVTCAPGAPNAYFVGVIYDSNNPDNPTNDFVIDVDNFEFFLATLRESYCIPDAQAKIYAHQNGFTRNGKTYEEGSVANLNAALAAFGPSANANPGSTVFVMVSSHGLAYVSHACPTGLRAPGSFSALKGDSLFDCDLGDWLNTRFNAGTRMVVVVDCSLCGGFSDSLTAASGTLPDNNLPRSSGVPGQNRVVITGCAITTECFGGSQGGVSYKHLKRALTISPTFCDGYSSPGFPQVQGVNAPLKSPLLNPPDGRCTASEWFYAAVWSAYSGADAIAIQEQFRMKWAMGSLANDIVIR